jgi:hypothetical protein
MFVFPVASPFRKRQADAVQALKFHGMSLSIWEIGQP